MKPEDVPFLLRKIGEQAESRLSNAINGREPDKTDVPEPRLSNDPNYIEPDWDDLDRKANTIVAGYAVASALWNVLPPPLDVIGVTATFTKMTADLSGVYQVMVSPKRARQMGWAIASTTASVLGVAFAGSRLMKFIPGAGWLASLLVQAPIVGAVAWAAGDALKWYFRESKRGVEPSISSLQDAFAKTLHIKIRRVKEVKVTEPGKKTTETVADVIPVATTEAKPMDFTEKIASLYELKQIGAISQQEFDTAKAELLRKL